MENFTPYASLIGGVLVGLGAATLLLINGKIAGISGILAGMLPPHREDTLWRVAFLAGLLTGGAVMWRITPEAFDLTGMLSLPWLVAAGLAVGIGTGVARGCTSGHGVCGLARLSHRSLAATCTFVATAMITVYIVRHVAILD